MDLLFRILVSIANIIYTIHTWILSFISYKKPPSVPPITDSFYLLSTTTIAKKIRLRELTSYEVVAAYIERIKVVNPVINAVVDNRFVAALKEAKICDEQLRSGMYNVETLEKEKPLFGVPFSVKESIPVKGLSYTGGTLARKGVTATDDNTIVRLLRDAGAIPLCVTNTPELCSGIDSTNHLFGRVRNVYDTRFTAGGSSGGEGALVGAGASSFGIGSDFGGSVRLPACFNGIFGYKFTTGITPNGEHFPESNDANFHKYLCISQLTRCAEDLTLITKVLTSKCDRDLRLDVPVNFSQLKVYYRLGMDKTFGLMPVAPEIKECILRAAKYFTRYGVRAEKLPIEWPNNMPEILLSSYKDLKIPNLLLDVNDPKLRKNPLTEMAKALIGRSHHTKSLILFVCMKNAPLFTPVSYYKQQKEIIRQKLLDLLGDNGIFFYPTVRIPPSHPNLMAYELFNSLVYPAVANIFGFPAVHVPMGLNHDGLPIGVGVIAAPYQDRLCLAVAKELERAFGGWVQPAVSMHK